MGSKRQILSVEAEKELENHIEFMDESFYGLSILEIRTYVYQYCETNNINHPFNKETKLAGKDFVYGFMKRHPRLFLSKLDQFSRMTPKSFLLDENPKCSNLPQKFSLRKLRTITYESLWLPINV